MPATAMSGVSAGDAVVVVVVTVVVVGLVVEGAGAPVVVLTLELVVVVTAGSVVVAIAMGVVTRFDVVVFRWVVGGAAGASVVGTSVAGA